MTKFKWRVLCCPHRPKLSEIKFVLDTFTDEQVKIEAISVLRTIFGQDIPDAEEILFSRLHYDPLFHGSYSSWPLG